MTTWDDIDGIWNLKGPYAFVLEQNEDVKWSSFSLEATSSSCSISHSRSASALWSLSVALSDSGSAATTFTLHPTMAFASKKSKSLIAAYRLELASYLRSHLI
ncbi:uncharacterized protein LACBIDRAFT_335648 [Laccaria bicolor S238N-H82]|uniref:Predicted protein n=1 Tax=Laccaria bicolor (strain S238N-H82 / ATCC MYA-4686) TaxID=486041 RepID=B0E2Y5_LACBS|nr:uncharacterized protein LACBIDRAFT_335648 [Laccaria bicolor S238N-H82]EDQ98794.1 predicted protein [Laccaria bicolor S238N-H82]|eukprot:XP_001890553.1 predicted protein [Laccaria bicolor S238N-H82]